MTFSTYKGTTVLMLTKTYVTILKYFEINKIKNILPYNFKYFFFVLACILHINLIFQTMKCFHLFSFIFT